MPHAKPVLMVIAEPNGSGKTAATKILCSKYPQWTKGLLEINPDVIAEKEFGSWNDPVCIRKAAQRADELREKYLNDRKDFPDWIKPIYRAAREASQ